MIVAELADELGLPVSAVTQACLRLDIDAAWSGAELSDPDVVLLRDDLGLAASPGDAAVHRLAPAAVRPEDLEGLEGRVQGGVPAGDEGVPGDPGDPGDPRGHLAPDAVMEHEARRRDARAEGRRAYDRGLVTAAKTLVLAAVAIVAATAVELPVGILLLCLAAVLLLVMTVVAANRARYRITTHPERKKGLGFALALLAVGVAGLVGLGFVTWTVVRSEPVEDAPLGIDTLDSVDQLRWGYQRVRLLADNGWESPAKREGRCWTLDTSTSGTRSGERVEFDGRMVPCRLSHTVEVIDTFAANSDADAAFPGVAALEAQAIARCAPKVAALNRANAGDPSAKALLLVERPTKAGWDAADHDLVCLAVTPERTGSLSD